MEGERPPVRGQVTCGLKVCDARGEVLREDLGRTPLPHDVAPGESIEIEMTVAGVLPAGPYQLRFDMVVEGVTWFEFQGSACLPSARGGVRPGSDHRGLTRSDPGLTPV